MRRKIFRPMDLKKFILSLFIFSLLGPIPIRAEEELTAECKKLLDETKEHYVNLVANDVLASFDLLENVKGKNAIYFTASELWKIEVLTGKNSHIESLKKIMVGKYLGEKRVYFFNQDPAVSYVLFKDVNHNNIMLTLKRDQSKWIVTNKKMKKGKQIKVETSECKDQHFMQKMFDNLYP